MRLDNDVKSRVKNRVMLPVVEQAILNWVLNKLRGVRTNLKGSLWCKVRIQREIYFEGKPVGQYGEPTGIGVTEGNRVWRDPRPATRVTSSARTMPIERPKAIKGIKVPRRPRSPATLEDLKNAIGYRRDVSAGQGKTIISLHIVKRVDIDRLH